MTTIEPFLSPYMCTLILGVMMFLWVLKNLPFINLDAAINLQRYLFDLLHKVNKLAEEIQDEIDKQEREKHRDE